MQILMLRNLRALLIWVGSFFPSTSFSAVRSIWEHLDALARYEGTTVLITTHYVEEARQADTVEARQADTVGQSVTVHSKLKGMRP